VCVCVCVPRRVCVCVFLCVFAYTYVCIYTCIYIYIHTYMSAEAYTLPPTLLRLPCSFVVCMCLAALLPACVFIPSLGIVTGHASMSRANVVVFPQHRDRSRFHVTCYSASRKEDATTRRFKSLADKWRLVFGVRAQEVAAMVQADEIDILIELAGHTAGNRLDVMALRPAPVQVGTNNTVA
jgi:hypothetical protein